MDVSFELAGALEGARDHSGTLILETPHLRFANPRRLSLNAYGLGPFSRLQLPPLPNSPGVYAVIGGSDELLYVGRARDSLRERWGRRGYSVIDPRNCYAGGQSTNCRLNRLITGRLAEGAPLSLWYHLTADPDELEAHLLGALRPPWNIR